MSKANRWVDFIRKWAKDNDTTYSCALSDPKCKAAYRAKFGDKKPVPAKTERERMGLEDVNRAEKPKPKKSFKQKVEEYLAELKAKPDEPKTAKRMKRAEDNEPIRVKKITIDGKIYLVDKATGTQFFDLESQDPIEDPRKASDDESRLAAFIAAKRAAKGLPPPALESERDTATADQIYIDIMMSIPKPNVTYTASEAKRELANLDEIEGIIENSLKVKRITKKEAAALRGKKGLAFVRDVVKKAGSSSGGKKGAKAAFRSAKKGIDKGLSKTAQGLNMINPVYQFTTKAPPEVIDVMGNLSYNYALPAMVSMGYYAYIAAAEGAATMMGLPPQVGKVAAETLWDEMVVKPGYDPRERQKSKFIGSLADSSGRMAFGGGSFYRL